MRWVTVGEVVSLSLYELRSLSSGCSCRGGGDGGAAQRTAAQHNMHAARFVPHRKELHRAQFGMSRTGLAPATAMPALAALAMHTNTCTRAENA